MKKRNTAHTVSYSFDPRMIPKVFLTRDLARSANSMAVADSLFEIEKRFRNGDTIRKATVALYNASTLGYNLSALKQLLRDLMVFVLAEDIVITLGRAKFETSPDRRPSPAGSARTVCLFSGGADSYAGILLAQRRLGSVAGVFAAHSDQARMIHIVRRIEKRVLERASIALHELRVPSVGAHGYAQLRGFLYMVGAAAWVDVLQADRLLVTECGPTMYQPKFAPLDSITMTTHPVVVGFASRVIAILLQRPIEIVTPFEDLTKAEVLAISPEKSGLRFTHSCISQRFGRHDGTCYGCVIRRLAAIAADVGDVHYDKNPMVDSHANAGNLMSLLAFSHDLLTNYAGMDAYEVEMIEAHSKQDLFRRFALDNFAAIHRLIEKGRRVRLPIRELYRSLVEKVGREALPARLEELRRGRFTPAL